MAWRLTSQTKSKWYFWKFFGTFMRFSFFLGTTSSSKWSALILRCHRKISTWFYLIGSLLFLIYINDLPNDLSSNCKPFAHNTSLFSVVNNLHTSATTLNQDLNAIANWAFRWKMIFNPDLSKQVQEGIFSRKIKKLLHPTL